MDKRFKKAQWGPNGTRPVTSDDNWKKVLRWNEAAKLAGKKATVFCASLADVFEDREDLAEPRERLFNLVEKTHWLHWLILTKRPQQAWSVFNTTARRPNHNVWLGTSVEDEDSFEQRVPVLQTVLASGRFLSIEPLLGSLHNVLTPRSLAGIDWVIVGGESGPKARPCDTRWIYEVIRDCRLEQIPCFVKQLGRFSFNSGTISGATDQRLYFKDPKGGDPDEWAQSLRVRQFPEAFSDTPTGA